MISKFPWTLSKNNYYYNLFFGIRYMNILRFMCMSYFTLKLFFISKISYIYFYSLIIPLQSNKIIDLFIYLTGSTLITIKVKGILIKINKNKIKFMDKMDI